MTSRLGPLDSRQAFRLVGFYEYSNALHNLDSLIRDLEPKELKAVNDFVKSRDEFVVNVNLARFVPQPANPLVESPQFKGDKFARRGLDWVTALARTEVAAMLATHTRTRQPFNAMSPTTFDARAYKELLLDGARTHYWALKNDRSLRKVVSRVPITERSLAYSRRLILTRAFMRVAMHVFADEYNAAQKKSLTDWKGEMDATQAVLVLNMKTYLQSGIGVAQKQFNYDCQLQVESDFGFSMGWSAKGEKCWRFDKMFNRLGTNAIGPYFSPGQSSR